MNSIIVLLLLSASVASAQSATSKADDRVIGYCKPGYHVRDFGDTIFACDKDAPKRAKPKPSVKKKAAPECLGGGCDPGINPPSDSFFIHCPETGCFATLPESTHVIVDPKPQEEPKKPTGWEFRHTPQDGYYCAKGYHYHVTDGVLDCETDDAWKAKSEALQLKDDPSKLCDALSPTEKISCLMNIVAPTAPEATSPMPVYVREPVTQVVAHCPEGWHVEVWRPAYNPNVGIYGLPLFSGWEAGYVADNRPMKITMTIDKEHPDRCAVDVK